MVTKMSKVIFSIFFALFICLNSFAVAPFSNRQGTLYFPIAWEITSDDSVNPAQFSSSILTLQNTKTGSKFTQPFDTKIINTRNGKQTVIFFAKKITMLPSGDYNLVSFTTNYQKAQNAFNLNTSAPIAYNIVSDKMTVMGGIFVQSALTQKSTLNTPKIVYLNQFSLGYDKLTNDLKKDDRLSSASQLVDLINFSNSSSPHIVREFPTQAPTAQNLNSLAHYGVGINMPCSFTGIAEMILQRENEPIYYLNSVPINQKNCGKTGEGEYPNPMNLYLNTGKWSVNTLAQASFDSLTTSGFNLINQPDLLNYYQTNKMDFLKSSAVSKSPNRTFLFTVQNTMMTKQFFYIGAFEWQMDVKNQPNLFFVRKFFLVDIRKLFGFSQVFNGYTGARMAHHKVLGSVSVFFREVNVAKANKTEVEKFEKASLQSITTCIQESNKIDPLLSVDGQILFYNDPKNPKSVASEIKFPDASESTAGIRTCLIAQFRNLPLIKSEFSINAEVSSL